MLVGGGVFGFVVFGVVVFGFVLFGLVLLGLVVFGLVPLGLVSLGVPFGLCPFGVSLLPLGFVVPGFPGFVVPEVPVLGVVGVVPGFAVPGVCPVGGFTEPVGGGACVDPGVRDWPLCPAAPGAAPPGADPAEPAPPGAACAIIQVAHSKTIERKVGFLVDMMEGLQKTSAMRSLLPAQCRFEMKRKVSGGCRRVTSQEG